MCQVFIGADPDLYAGRARSLRLHGVATSVKQALAWPITKEMPMSTTLKHFATAVVAVVEPETTALTVAQLMRQHHIGALVVVDAQEKTRPIGIVTDRDLVLSLMAEGLDPTLFTAGDIMSIELVVANADLDATDAVQLMRTQRVRRLVLVDDQGALAGIVTMEDVLELLTRELANLAAGVIGARDREFEYRH